MLQQALEYESQEAEKQEVTAEAVEEAMLERLQLARDMETALEGCQYFGHGGNLDPEIYITKAIHSLQANLSMKCFAFRFHFVFVYMPGFHDSPF